MTAQMSDDEYAMVLTQRILEAIVLADDDGTGQGGYVRPEPSKSAVALALATMLASERPKMSLREMRQATDSFSKALMTSLKAMAQRQAEGGDILARAVPVTKQ